LSDDRILIHSNLLCLHTFWVFIGKIKILTKKMTYYRQRARRFPVATWSMQLKPSLWSSGSATANLL